MGNLFELQAILRQVHRMTPKLTLGDQSYLIYVLQVLRSPIFKFVPLPAVLEFQAILTIVHRISLNTKKKKKKKKSKVPHTYY